MYLLVKLSARNSLFPRSLFLYGTQLGSDREAVAGGRYADIYRGLLGPQDVAIKRMRVYAKEESARCRKASILVSCCHAKLSLMLYSRCCTKKQSSGASYNIHMSCRF
jgi:hypothetical protein